MNYKDLVWLGYNDLNEKRVRTALTILMIVIGVASIVALISLTEGISASIQSSLSTLGPTSILVSSAKASGFTLADTAQISALPNASTVIPILTGTATILSGSENVSATIIGISPQDLQAAVGGNVSIYEGSTYPDSASPASLIGHSIAFPSSSSGRQNIFIGSAVTALTQSGSRSTQSTIIPVSGILNSSNSLLVPVDTSVIMSMLAAQTLLHRNSFNEILIKAKNTSSVVPLANLIIQIYGSNARVIDTQEIAATAAQIVVSITVLLVVIAGISLMVAAIGIMNVMLMSVMERTHEIGIMKSLGFRNKDVMALFLFQALLVGVIGGILGIAVGAGVSYGLAAAASHASSAGPSASSGQSGATVRTGPGGSGGAAAFGGGPSSSSSSGSLTFSPMLSASTIIGALVVAMLVSGAAGLYPAWRASRLEPIEALRTL